MYSIIYNTNKESAVCYCSLTKRILPIKNLCTMSLQICTGLLKSRQRGLYRRKVGQALLDQPDNQNIKTLG